MLGKKNSVLSRLKNKQPHLYNLGCVCHVAHTCSKNAAEALGRDIEKLVIDIYYYFDKRYIFNSIIYGLKRGMQLDLYYSCFYVGIIRFILSY